jgi:hypothetical protein
MKDHDKVAVKSLRAPRDETYLQHTRPFSPTCTCESCRRLTGGGTDSSRPQSARSLTLSSEKNTVGLMFGRVWLMIMWNLSPSP